VSVVYGCQAVSNVRHWLSSPWLSAGLLLLLSLPLFFWGLGDRHLWIPLEARYVLVAREMAESNRWILPHLDGQIYPDKPPLLFWAIALSSSFASGVSEWTARVPSAIAAVGVCLLTWGMGARLFSLKAGTLAALILITSAGFFWSGRQALPDMLLTLWITGALWALWEWVVAKRRMAALVAGLCMGLATLTKGPVGVVLPVLILLFYVALRRQWRALGGVEILGSIAIFLGVVLSWFLPAIGQGGLAYVQATLLHHTLERYVRSWEHTAPWYFYLGAFPAEFLPWTLFLPQALAVGPQQKPLHSREGWWFALCWLVAILGFFSLSSGKRDIYILPAFPAAALLVGWLWACWWERAHERRHAWAIRLPALLLGLGLVGFAGGLWGGFEGLVPRKSSLLLPSSSDLRVWMYLLTILAGSIIGVAALTGRARWVYTSILGCTWLAMLIAVVWVHTPQFNARYPIKAFAARVHVEAPPDLPLRLCGPLNDLALRLNLKRYTPAVPAMSEVMEYLRGEGEAYCIIDRAFYQELLGLGGPPLVILAEEKFGPAELLLISNRR